MNMVSKVLVVGAGIGQVPLCRLVKQRGLFLIIVTIPGNYPCIALADKVYYIDIYDREEIVRVAREEHIDAVISDQNDLMMPTVAYVAERLGLPGNTFVQVNSYCNKNIFRENCDKLLIPSPKHCKVHQREIPAGFTNIPFPWVVKPEDSQSSIGVAKVDNEDEYFEALTFALLKSKNKTAIVEEFFEGREVVVEGFIYNGDYYNLGIADRKYFKLDRMFIPSQTIFPSVISVELKNRLIGYEQAYTGYVHPDFAIVHSEYLINERTGEIRVVESALRGGGVYISSHLVPLSTGIGINDTLIDCALGKEIDIQVLLSRNVRKAAAYICFYLPEGIVRSISGLEKIKGLPYVYQCDVSVEVGDAVKEMTYKGQRLGPVIVSGESRMDIEEKICTIQEILEIKVQSEKGELLGIVWD